MIFLGPRFSMHSVLQPNDRDAASYIAPSCTDAGFIRSSLGVSNPENVGDHLCELRNPPHGLRDLKDF